MSNLEEYLLIVDNPEYIKEFTEIQSSAINYALIVEKFQKLLGVYTTPEALAKVSVLMREETLAENLLSKCLGHLRTCPEYDSDTLYGEIAEVFGESGLTKRAPDEATGCAHRVVNPVGINYVICENCGKTLRR